MRKLSKTSGVTEYFPDLGPPQRAPFKPMWGPRDQQQRWGKYPGRQIGSIVHGALAVASGLSARPARGALLGTCRHHGNTICF